VVDIDEEVDNPIDETSDAINGSSFFLNAAAQGELDDKGIPKLTFQGYSGNAVDLSDYGFDAPVVYDIASMSINKVTKILYNHSPSDAIGHTTNVRKVDNNSAIRGKGLASLPGPSTTKVVEGIKNGFPWEGSMGLRMPNPEKNFTYISKGEISVNNRTFKAPIYVAYDSVLYEMTVTEFGRDSDTSFLMNKDTLMKIKNNANNPPPLKTDDKDKEKEAPNQLNNQKPKDEPKHDDKKPEPEVVENSLDEGEITTLKNILNKLEGKPPKKPVHDTVNNNGGIKKLDSETVRFYKLSKMFPDNMDLVIDGMEKGHDDETITNSIRLKNLDDDLYTPPSPERKQQRENQDLIRMSLAFGNTPEFMESKGFDKKAIDAANNMGQASLVELLLKVANSSGGRFTGHSDVEQMCKHIKNVGYSTFDLPHFFSQVGSFLREERWKIAKPIAPQICKQGSNTDFKKARRFRMFGGQVWNEVAPDGKIDLWTAGDERYYDTNLKTHGALFTFTRQDVINDDIGALNEMMDIMVESASMMPDIELGKYLLVETEENSSGFWVEGANSIYSRAFNRTNLETTWNAMRTYTEPKEDFGWTQMLDDTWRIIHGPALDIAIFDIFKQSVIVGNTTANTIQGQQNFWYNKMDPLLFPQMTNTSVYGASPFVNAGTWILWPRSTQFAPYEITYLRGKKTPTIEAVDLPAEMLGFGVRGYWDFKINKRDGSAIRRMTPVADAD
jgi:hypothetical protein